MLNEKWNEFMMSGKISDYLEYRKAVEEYTAKDDELNGDTDTSWDSPEGISCW